MRRFVFGMCAVALVTAGIAGAQTTFERETAAARAQSAAAAKSPNGWLTLIALEWLKPGETTVGSAEDNRVKIAGVPPHVGVIVVDGVSSSLRPPAGGFPAEVAVDGRALVAGPLLSDATGRPTAVHCGTVTMTVIARGDRLYLRVKDSQAPTRVNFHGLNWYPPDVKYRLKAKWIPYSPPKFVSIPNVLGQTSSNASPGAIEFSIGGRTYRLDATGGDDKELSFIFRDLTSKTTTYGAGRFLETGGPDHGLLVGGTVVVDFNRAYNPPCAYTPYATCPLPPEQNRLAVAIPAGEKRYHE